MIFGYELIATDMYTVPAYQHVTEPEKQSKSGSVLR